MISIVALLVLAWASFAQADVLSVTCAQGPPTGQGIPGCAPAILPIVSASAEASHVFKASPGTVYGIYATNLTGTAGFLVVLNATTAPSDGAITPLDCVPLPASGTASINFNPGPGATYNTGIVAVVTSAATCFTKTTGVITAFFRGAAQ